MESLFQLAEKSGVFVEYGRFPANSSLSAKVGAKRFVALDYGLLFQSKQERTHLAHELGHCMTDSFYNLYSPIDVRGRHEERANRWAIRALIPREELTEAVADGITELWDLADHFQVTELFMQKAVEYYKMLETA